MSATAWNIHDLMLREARLDCQLMVNQATSGCLGGFSGLPVAVSDTSIIYCELGINGRLTAERKELLQKALRQHLEISQTHSRIWLEEDPDPMELVQAWHYQNESLKCWDHFIKLYQRLKDIEVAYSLAFDNFTLQEPDFDKEDERLAYAALLKNQQQRFVNGENMVPVAVLKEDPLLKALEPTHLGLYNLLKDGLPKSVKTLLLEAFGKKALSTENKNHLYRRINELNCQLEKHWGKSPRKRWIVGAVISGEYTYCLEK